MHGYEESMVKVAFAYLSFKDKSTYHVAFIHALQEQHQTRMWRRESHRWQKKYRNQFNLIAKASKITLNIVSRDMEKVS